MLRLSLVSNAILAIVCVVLSAKNHRNTEPAIPQSDLNPRVITNIVEKEVEVPRQLSEEERKAIEMAAIAAVRHGIETNAVETARNDIEAAAVRAEFKRLANAFPKDKRINDSEKWTLPRLDNMEDGSLPQYKPFLDKLRFYVNFTNTNLLEKANQ